MSKIKEEIEKVLEDAGHGWHWKSSKVAPKVNELLSLFTRQGEKIRKEVVEETLKIGHEIYPDYTPSGMWLSELDKRLRDLLKKEIER